MKTGINSGSVPIFTRVKKFYMSRRFDAVIHLFWTKWNSISWFYKYEFIDEGINAYEQEVSDARSGQQALLRYITIATADKNFKIAVTKEADAKRIPPAWLELLSATTIHVFKVSGQLQKLVAKWEERLLTRITDV